ncbi:MAG: PilZ domain-containing protein [Pseudomonadota bacterium]
MTKLTNSILIALGLVDIGSELPIPGERRAEYRRPVKIPAVAEIMEPYNRLDCTVIDITNSGAQLLFESTEEIPRQFRLYILQLNVILECSIAWRNETNMGVSFTPVVPDFTEGAERPS